MTFPVETITAPTGMRVLFYNCDMEPVMGKMNSGGQPANAGANDDDRFRVHSFSGEFVWIVEC